MKTETQTNAVSTLIPISKLRVSTFNVRSTKADPVADAGLMASIQKNGVRQNLIVRPCGDDPNTFEVLAGERRFTLSGKLVKKGIFPKSYALPCVIDEASTAGEVSLSENVHRAAMHPADEFVAYKGMIEQGMDEDSIATHFGIEVDMVRKRLKLGTVHPKILKAYREDVINLESVMAFTLADTHKQQLAVFKELGMGQQCWANNVRRLITKEGESSDSAAAKFVGLGAYEKAGGGLVYDLFGERSYLTDRELLLTLLKDKLEASAARLKSREGWANVEVVLSGYPETHTYLRVEPEPVGVPEALQAKLNETIATQNKMEEQDIDWTEEREAAFDKLTDEIDALEAKVDGYRVYTDHQKLQAICFVSVNHSGKTQIDRGFMSRTKQKQLAQSCSEAGEGSVIDTSLSNALVSDLGIHRQQIAKAHLLTNPKLASDVLLYALAKQVLARGYEDRLIDAQFSPVMPPLMNAGDEHAESKAGKALITARDKLSTDWLTKKTDGERFDALTQLTVKQKQALNTYCVAVLLSCHLNDDAKSMPAAALSSLAPEYAANWRPTADNYFSRLKIANLLEHGQDWFGKQWAEDNKNLSKKALVGLLDQFFNAPADKGLSKKLATIRETWLPDGFVSS